MTALCSGGGPSQPLPAAVILQNLSPNAIIALLYSEGMAWFGAIAYGVGYLAYDLSGLCTTDPPALPNVDAARLWGYANPLNPQGAAQLRADAQAIVGYWLWFQYCECVTGPQPTKGPAPPQPTGQATDQTINPPTPGDCGQFKVWFESLGFNATNDAIARGQPPAVPNGAAQWYELQINFRQADTISPPVPTDLSVTVVEFAGGSVVGGTHTFQWNAGTPQPVIATYRYPWHATITDFELQIHALQAPITNIEVVATIKMYCSPLPIALSPACCPPDPNLLALINEVLQLEQEILAKAGGSIAYTKGTVHSSLSGSSSLSVSALRGVLVDITAGAPTKPPLIGNPPYLWDMGWLSMMDADGMIQEQRLTRTHQVWTPRLSPNATVVGYYFNPGVVANITELLPA